MLKHILVFFTILMLGVFLPVAYFTKQLCHFLIGRIERIGQFNNYVPGVLDPMTGMYNDKEPYKYRTDFPHPLNIDERAEVDKVLKQIEHLPIPNDWQPPCGH